MEACSPVCARTCVHWGRVPCAANNFQTLIMVGETSLNRIDQGSPTFLILEATLTIPSSTKGLFDTNFLNNKVAKLKNPL